MVGTNSLQIKTLFRSHWDPDTNCDVLELGARAEGNQALKLSALVVSFVCNPLTWKPINRSKQSYGHLVGDRRANWIRFILGSGDMTSCSGPTAIHTRVRWILSGPANHLEVLVNHTTASTHFWTSIFVPQWNQLRITTWNSSGTWNLSELLSTTPLCMTSLYRRPNLIDTSMKSAYCGRNSILHSRSSVNSAKKGWWVFSIYFPCEKVLQDLATDRHHITSWSAPRSSKTSWIRA